MKKQKRNEPKILFFDIENSPNKAYVWQLWTEVVSDNMIESPWFMLCYGAKWLHEKKVMSSALIDFSTEYKKDPENDKKVLEKLWKLLNEADIVIAHNAVKFDVRKTNARFIMNGMPPPSPYKIVDTLKVARKYFFFTSNKLDNLGKYLGVGEKMDTGGFKLWTGCMAGKKSAWKKMVAYCKRDVILLEKIYKKLLPYMSTHPNLGNYVDSESQSCPKCGSEKLVKEGFTYTNVAKYQQYSCKGCGGWSRGRKNIKENKVQISN